MKKKEDLSNSNKVQWEEYLKDPKDVFDKELSEKNHLAKIIDLVLICMDLL